jgi:transposase
MIGIDVSKESLSVCAWDEQHHRARWQWEVPNSEEGIARLVERVPAEEPWVVEPTGRYSELVARLGMAAGREVLLAPPLSAKRFLASVNPRAKTDRLDAEGLARYGASVPLRRFVFKEPHLERLSQLLCVRRSAAKALATFRVQSKALPEAAAHLRRLQQAVQEQLKSLDAQLAKLARKEPDIARLQQVHGIGLVTATALVVRLKTTDFTTSDRAVAYMGLDLRVCESGQYRGRKRLSKQGDANLRWLLYCCAQASVRSKGSPFLAHYEREQAKGLSRTAALCVVARKMARLAWSLIRSGAQYNPERVYSQISLDT